MLNKLNLNVSAKIAGRHLNEHYFDSFRLAIVIPCYNEEKRIDINSYLEYICSSAHFLFCFVDDGSTDNTWTIINALRDRSPERVIAIKKNINLGKAEAVRTGINYLKRYNIHYLGYWDADQATPFQELIRLFNIITAKESLLLIFGSRVSLFGTNVKRSGCRYYAGRIFSIVVRHILNLSIYDTQCGIKIFHRSLAGPVFKHPFKSRWLFDVEIFARIKACYGKQKMLTIVKEVPLNDYTEVHGSKIGVFDFLRTPLYLLSFLISIKGNKNSNLTIDIQPIKGTVNI